MSRLLITGLHSQSDEILAQIFLEHVEWATEDITHTSEGPWVPSHVCRSWRTIALAHPELWSTIRVEGPDNDDCDSEDELDLDPDASDSEDSGFSGTELGRPPKALFLLDLALERSQDHPLEVTLEFGMVEDTENGMAAVMRRMGEEAPSAKALNQKLIRAVVAHSNRWKTAELQITNALIPLFAPISNRLSLLTKLTIWTFEESPAPFPWARHAPRLTDVRLNDYAHESITLPWGSIRHFSETLLFPGRGPTTNPTQRYLRLLRNNPHLESLDVTYPSRSPLSSTSTLKHLSLRRLIAAEKSLIGSLTLPHLEELIVQPNIDTMSAIRDLLARSKCSLHTLRLINFVLNEDLLAILSSSTSLRTLIVRTEGWNAGGEEAAKLLVAKLAEPSFLPCLEDIDIIISPHSTADPWRPMQSPCKIRFINDAFVEMLAARWARRGTAVGGAHLKRVFVLVELPATVGLSKTRGVGGLQKMCDEGLDVFLRARDPRALTLVEDAKDISYVYDV